MTVNRIPAAPAHRATAQATIDVRVLLSALFFFCLCLSCEDPATGLCGSGNAALEIGLDDPLTPAPDNAFTIDEGNQGGYHVDVSIKVVGTIDPDDVDIRIRLSIGERQLALHRTDDWLLKIYESGPHCEYPKARLVLTNDDDSLMELDRVESLVGQNARLEIELSSPDGRAEGTFEIRLSDLIRQADPDP